MTFVNERKFLFFDIEMSKFLQSLAVLFCCDIIFSHHLLQLMFFFIFRDDMYELGWALSSIIAHRGLTWGWGIYNIVCKIELTFCFLHIVDNLSVIIFWWPKLMKGQLPIPGWSISKWQIQQNSARWHFLHREMTLISSTDDNVYTVLMHWFTFWLFICEGCSWCLERGQSRPLPSLGPSWSQD